VKRAFDVVAASLGLAMTSPLIVAAAIAVKLESKGPAFYSGPRVGRDGRVFKIHKLRTMRAGADATGPAVTAADDVRVTALGRWLRWTKADELPQLLNVVKGEMSLVGPRPEHPDFVRHYTPEQRRLLSVRPGLTLLHYFDADVSGRDFAHGKPDPEPYERMSTLLGVEPVDMLVFEDTEAGVASAKAAGARVVAVTRTLGADRLRAADSLAARLDAELIRRCS